MKICFPVQKDEGLESRVYGHFGSAPMFVVADSETHDVSIIKNGNRQHVPGACNPAQALDGRKVDVVVAGGIGAGALSRLNQMGIRVHKAGAPTVRENLALIASRGLPEYTLERCCGGHGQGRNEGGCAH